MKKYIILSGLLAMLATTACNNSSNQSTETPAAEKPAAPRDSVQPDGTTVKVNDQGIIIENKDGDKKNNVNISKDSASIEISKPK